MNKQTLQTLLDNQRFDDALKLVALLLAKSPKDLELIWVHSNLLLKKGQHEAALNGLFRICEQPSRLYVPAIILASQVAFDHGYWGHVVGPSIELCKLPEHRDQAYFRLGVAYVNLQLWVKAVKAFENVSDGSPDFYRAQFQLGIALSVCGRADDGIRHIEKGIEIAPDAEVSAFWQHYLFALLNCEGVDEQYVYQKHVENAQRFQRQLQDGLPQELVTSLPKPDETIHLGLISADFNEHSVTSFLLPLLRNLESAQWRVTLYSKSKKLDRFSDELKALAHDWVCVAESSPEELVSIVRQRQEHIIVDLMGCSSQPVLRELTMRLAPTQVSYLGYPFTNGVSAVDYRIVDVLTDPDESAYQDVCVESLFRLDRSFLCFESLVRGDDFPVYLEKDVCVFGCFNTSTKYTPQIVSAWIAILQRVPRSVLMLKAKVFNDPDFVEQFALRFQEAGIDRARLKFIGWTETKEEHLALYDQIDVHLDTFPYNGTTTTYESLWQGVPTICVEGSSHRSRVSASIMRRIGKEEWVGSSFEEYIEKAVNLSVEKQQLREFKQNSRELMRAADLLNGGKMVQALDAAFREMIDLASS